jgi:parallel beta-helix repeat protein
MIATNLIVYGNQAAVSNDIAGVTGGVFFSCSPSLTAGGSSSNITSDPLFIDNGSGYGTNAVLGDYRLQTNSPCIGLGKNLSWMTSDPLVDLDGNYRIRPSWGRVDMGAYEAYPQAGLLTNSFSFAPATGAAPLQVSFAAETSGNTNGLLYRWFFGDGASLDWSSTGSPIHVYSARTNAYTVTLGVSNALGESASRTFTNAIMAYPVIVYVATNGAHVAPFESWANAATNLQAAVDVAGAGISTVLVGDGTYRIASPVAITRGITVASQNGAGATVVAGRWPQSTNRCFTITAAGAVLDGLTITNGCSRDFEGGGVNMTAAGIVRNCVFIGNRSEGTSASGGGGISFSAGSVINCLFQNNAAVNYNGGAVIMSGASSLLSNCVVVGNTANLAGGGLYQSAGLVTHCVMSNNVSGTVGGGLYKWSSAAGAIQNCLIAGNRAGSSAGGLYIGTSGGATVQNCTIADNVAVTWAGGLEVLVGTVRNCIIDGNASPRQGQENVTLSGGTFVTNLTVPLLAGAGNLTGDPGFADRAGGDYRIRGGSPAIDTADDPSSPSTDLNGLARPRDGNGDGLAAPDLGAYESLGMASGDLRCSFAASTLEAFDAVTVAFTAVAEGADTNGLLYQWSFGDGTTSAWSSATRTLSHAYGIGTFSVVLSVSNASDQSASWSASVRVLPSALYVAPGGSHQWPYTNWSTAATNLQSAIDAAGSTPTTGSWVWVASGVYTVRQPVVLASHVTLKSAAGSAATIINGNYPATSNRCLTMNASGAAVDGFTLTGGFAAETSGPGSIGGGAYLKLGTIRNCDIRFNQAYNGGGGIYMEMASLLDSTVYGNLGSKTLVSPAGPGGVYYNGLAGYESVISNCWIACNTNNNTGGGIGELNGLISNCRIERNVTLLNNTGTGGGGARINYTTMENCEVVSNSSASVAGGVHLIQYGIMRNCLVAANEAKGIGGGVNEPSNTGARQKLENCTIVGNSATNGGGVYGIVALANGTNCIVTGNRATMPGGANDIGGTFTNFAYSCSPSLAAGISNNITADPAFVRNGSGFGLAHVMGDYRLKAGSPCVDAGAVLPGMAGALDLEGNPRILNAAPNMGAYEKVVKRTGILIQVR